MASVSLQLTKVPPFDEAQVRQGHLHNSLTRHFNAQLATSARCKQTKRIVPLLIPYAAKHPEMLKSDEGIVKIVFKQLFVMQGPYNISDAEAGTLLINFTRILNDFRKQQASQNS
jgi:hypothetical protein